MSTQQLTPSPKSFNKLPTETRPPSILCTAMARSISSSSYHPSKSIFSEDYQPLCKSYPTKFHRFFLNLRLFHEFRNIWGPERAARGIMSSFRKPPSRELQRSTPKNISGKISMIQKASPSSPQSSSKSPEILEQLRRRCHVLEHTTASSS